MIRLQTYYILLNNGAKVSSPQELWTLDSDTEEDGKDIPAWAATSIEMRKKILKDLGLTNEAT